MKTNILLFCLIVALLVSGCVPVATVNASSVRQNRTGADTGTVYLPIITQEAHSSPENLTYPIVDTGQARCYDNRSHMNCPASGAAFSGQDALYAGSQPQYQDNDDGTVTDVVTGLMWQQDPGQKMTYHQAVAGADSFELAGYTDWRLPTIKELYSLILFSGIDPKEFQNADTSQLTPFIADVFAFQYGNVSQGERIIDSQFASSTKYVSTTMNGNDTMFGVNFADGRIKGYPTGPMPGQTTGKLFYVLYVRGTSTYGINNFTDNGNGTIIDLATGLTWMESDSGGGTQSAGAMNWEAALNYCESLDFAGASDWRLPNVKELQSIVDYSRSPDTTQSAAINAIFQATEIKNEAGQSDYPAYWSSTTHVNSIAADFAAYVSFGRALGYMHNQWMDVHGAGAQRSDPKSGDPSQHALGKGPQGDSIRINNYARCVRGGTASSIP